MSVIVKQKLKNQVDKDSLLKVLFGITSALDKKNVLLLIRIAQAMIPEETETTISGVDDCFAKFKAISTSTIKIKNEIATSNKEIDLWFDGLFALYPRKEGRTQGKKRFRREIKTLKDLDLITIAVKEYARLVTIENRSKNYIKMFSSFMSVWRDYIPEKKPKTMEDDYINNLNKDHGSE